jgi:hypothetical protein
MSEDNNLDIVNLRLGLGLGLGLVSKNVIPASI